MTICAWWLNAFGKFAQEEVKRQPEDLENGQFQSGLLLKRIASSSLSRNMSIMLICTKRKIFAEI